MSPFTIRKAVPLDEITVLPLAEAFHLEDGHPLAPTGAAAIRALLEGNPLGEIYLVESAGDTLGYFALCFTMSLEFGGVVVILDDLYLAPDARGRGVGAGILAKVEAVAREKKAVQIFLEVENANRRAFEFYGRHGFVLRERQMMDKRLR